MRADARVNLSSYCPTIAAFENRGVGGSTAREWQEAEGCGGTACSPAAAFDGEYTHAWVSIGGNDFITAYFTRDDDEFLFHEKHASELKATEDEVVCSVCAAPCKKGFEALDGVGGLCEACAKVGTVHKS